MVGSLSGSFDLAFIALFMRHPSASPRRLRALVSLRWCVCGACNDANSAARPVRSAVPTGVFRILPVVSPLQGPQIEPHQLKQFIMNLRELRIRLSARIWLRRRRNYSLPGYIDGLFSFREEKKQKKTRGMAQIETNGIWARRASRCVPPHRNL